MSDMDLPLAVRMMQDGYLMKIDELQSENEKLRELVRDALTTISWCTIDCYPSDNKKRELNERARELGVEI